MRVQGNPLLQGNPLRLLVVMSCLAVLAIAAPATAAETPRLSRVVAWDGMSAPGLPAGTLLLGLGSHPVINNDDEVAFPAQLGSPDPDLNFSWSIWTEGGGLGLRAVAIEGMVPPGVADPNAEYVTLGSRVLIDETGHTAFNATWTDGAGTFHQGIWVGQPDGAVRRVVVTGMPAPDTPLNHEFTRLGFETNFLSWWDAQFFLGGGRLAFFADTVDDPDAADPEPGTLNGIWSEGRTLSTRGLRVIARTGPDTTFGQPDLSGMNRLGWTIFKADINPQNDPIFNSIWSGEPALMVTRTGTESDAINFTGLGNDPTINPYCARTAFTARVSGEPFDADTGVYAQILADPSPVAFEGTVAPGLPDLSGDGVPDFLFGDFSGRPALMNARGEVVFKNLAKTPDQSQQIFGLWFSGIFGQRELVANVGMQAPGLPPGTVFSAIDDNIVLNNRGELAFTADFTAPDGTTGRGLWFWDGDEPILLLKAVLDASPDSMIQADTVALPDGTTLTADFMVFSGGNGSAGAVHGSGRLSGFSDEAVATAFVSDQSGGGAVVELREIVFRGNFEAPPQPEPSPEPAGGCVRVPR